MSRVQKGIIQNAIMALINIHEDRECLYALKCKVADMIRTLSDERDRP